MANGESPAKGALSTLLLFAAVVALAIAVVVLAWIAFGRLDDLLTKAEFQKRMDVVDAAHEGIKDSVEELGERIKVLEQLIGRCCTGSDPNPPSPPSRLNPRLEVMFENARVDDGPWLSEESRGITLSTEQGEKLTKFARALVACATPAQVRLKVQGYSSTREFQGASNSDDLNLDAANLRAEVVRAHLVAEGANEKNNVHVRHDPWRRYAEIQRPFKDAEGFSGITDQEQLNRVVYIELQDAGGCKQDV